MSKPSFPTSRAPRLALACLFALGACQSSKGSTLPPPPETRRAEITNELTALAEVVAIAPAERRLSLRREDGTSVVVQAGEGVRNFAEIAVGDTLKVQYRETLRASLRPPGESLEPVEAAFLAARAKPGAKPGAGLGAALSVRVRIESIDRERNIVVFAPASGDLFARRIVTPQGREFVAGLEVGDTVQLDYAESLAIAIQEL